jgi:Tfp pilus assembly protein PilO
MNKNIIVVVLVVLLIAVIGWGWSLQQGKATLQGQIKTLENEKGALQSKIKKGLGYAESLDVLFDAARAQGGLPTRYNFSSETEILSKLTDTIKATGDSKLQDYLNIMKQGGNAASTATVSFMYYTPSAIVDTLK